jgi:hypothetical protein
VAGGQVEEEAGVGSYKQKVLARAQQLGVEVEEIGSDVLLWAPEGHLFSGIDIHGFVESPWDGETKAGMWRVAWEDLKSGVEPCWLKDCEVCREGAK